MKIHYSEPTRDKHSRSQGSYFLAVASTPEEGLSNAEAEYILEKDG